MHVMRHKAKMAIGCVLTALAALTASAQVEPLSSVRARVVRSAATSSNAPAVPPGVPIETEADRMDYDDKRGVTKLIGNAFIRVISTGEELRADTITVDMKTGKAIALGHVLFKHGDRVWEGTELEYNIASRQIMSRDDFKYSEPPFFIDGAEMMSPTEDPTDKDYRLKKVTLTSCKYHDHPHYRLRARRLRVEPDEHLRAYHAVLYFYRVPLFYSPFWYADLDDRSGFHFEPGYGSDWGAYLLSSYRSQFGKNLRGETHLDYRSERGLAYGQDFRWSSRERGWSGELLTYYANDEEPFDDDEDPEESEVDSSRARVFFQHDGQVGEQTRLFSKIHYVSDPDVLHDFFDRQFRREPVPENYLNLTRRHDRYSASVLAEYQINDFYDSVDRLPEASVTFQRQQIRESKFYYGGRTEIALLERRSGFGDPDEEYDASRVDSDHQIFYPTRQFGYLNVIPRLGGRVTYFSKTLKTETSSAITTSTVVSADGATEEGADVTTEEGADARMVYEIGLESSFKAFKIWDSPAGRRRHVVEPRINWTYIPEPNVLPENLFQFDNVDKLDEEHFVRVGMRHKLQDKRKGLPHDLIDLDLSTVVRIKKDPGDDAINDISLDAEFRTAEWIDVDLEAVYSLQESTLDRAELQVDARLGENWIVDFDYLFREDRNSLLYVALAFTPSEAWRFGYYSRFEFEDSQFEEQGLWVLRTLDCLAIRTGINMIPAGARGDDPDEDDEWRAMLEVWLTAYPQDRVGGSYGPVAGYR